MKLTQSRQLLSFMASLNLEVDGTVSSSYFNQMVSYVSRFYTPELKSSKLSLDMSSLLQAGTTFTATETAEQNEIIRLSRLLDLKNSDPLAYKLLQLITLEVFSLVTVIDIAPESANEYSLEDAQRLHNNILYLIEYLNSSYTPTTTNNSDLDKAIVIYRINSLLKRLDVDAAYMYKVLSGNSLGGGNNAL